jgi:hypothetical protein
MPEHWRLKWTVKDGFKLGDKAGRRLVCTLWRGEHINAPLKLVREVANIHRASAKTEAESRMFWQRLTRELAEETSIDAESRARLEAQAARVVPPPPPEYLAQLYVRARAQVRFPLIPPGLSRDEYLRVLAERLYNERGGSEGFNLPRPVRRGSLREQAEEAAKSKVGGDEK